jgi:hypothetical protein
LERLPLLMTTPTFAPCFRRLPGLGFWEITRPFLTLLENACLTLPGEQEWVLSVRLAALRVLRLSFGTMQGGAGSPFTVSVTSEAAL